MILKQTRYAVYIGASGMARRRTACPEVTIWAAAFDKISICTAGTFILLILFVDVCVGILSRTTTLRILGATVKIAILTMAKNHGTATLRTRHDVAICRFLRFYGCRTCRRDKALQERDLII